MCIVGTMPCNRLISFAGHYLNAMNMRDGESSSFPSATQPLNPNNPYSPDGKSLLLVENLGSILNLISEMKTPWSLYVSS